MNAVKINTTYNYQTPFYFPQKAEISFKGSNNKIKDEFSSSQNSIMQQECKIEDVKNLVLKIVGLNHPLLKKHLIGTSIYAKAFAKEMGLSRKQIEEIEIAALFHDVSKIGHSDKFFQGEASLLDLRKNKQHHKTSSNIAKTITPLKRKIANLIKHHHDEFKKDGENIPLGSRILHICDKFDSMTTKKYPNSVVKTPQEAVLYLRKNKKDKWDAEIVEKFCVFISKNDFALYKQVKNNSYNT